MTISFYFAFDVALLLMKCGTDVKAQDVYENTPLYRASEWNGENQQLLRRLSGMALM
jgi:hypothetical protein